METIQTNLATRRIVVVTPDNLAAELGLAHRIHRLAVEKDCPVLYLTVVSDPHQMLTISRCMTTLAAATAGNRVEVDWRLTTRTDLFRVLNELSQPGDLLYSLRELPGSSGAVRIIPEDENSLIDLNFPAGPARPLWTRRFLPALITIAGFLAIIGGFTWLEIVLDQRLAGAIQPITLITAFCIEIGAIWIWNKLASW